MGRASLLQERRKMLFEEVYSVWTESRLTQEEAAQLLGVCPRTFRRWAGRYEEFGIDGLRDKRLSGLSHRAAPVDEVVRLVDLEGVVGVQESFLRACSRPGFRFRVSRSGYVVHLAETMSGRSSASARLGG